MPDWHWQMGNVDSTESLAMWQEIGEELGVTPANYVCGCGAGATPGRSLLETSPWRDAIAARTWDGRSSMDDWESA